MSSPADEEIGEMGGMLELVKQYLDAGGRSYQMQAFRDDGKVISMNLTGNNSSFRIIVLMIARYRMLVFIESPVKVPEHARGVVAELLMRINYTLALGNFEVDFRDGEVRYRMAVDVEGSHLSLQMIEMNIMVSAATMDRYFPSIMACTYRGKSPAEAFEEIRNPAVVFSGETASGFYRKHRWHQYLKNGILLLLGLSMWISGIMRQMPQ